MATTCMSFENRCKVYDPTNPATSPSWPGRNQIHHVHGYEQFNDFTQRWESILVEPDECQRITGRQVWSDEYERWVTLTPLSETEFTNCFTKDINMDFPASVDNLLGGHHFGWMKPRWGFLHRIRESIEFKYGGQHKRRDPAPGGEYPLAPWDVYYPPDPPIGFGAHCCGVGGPSLDPDAPNQPTNLPPPKLWVRFWGTSEGHNGICTSGDTLTNRWGFDFVLELHRTTVGLDFNYPGSPNDLGYVASYVCSPSDWATGPWTASSPARGPRGSVFIRSISIDGKHIDPVTFEPYINNCLAPDLCGSVAQQCGYLWLSIVSAKDSVDQAGDPLQSPCSNLDNNVFLVSDGFHISYPDQNAGIVSSAFRTNCQESCSDWNIDLIASNNHIYTDTNEVGCSGGIADYDFKMNIRSTPFFDFPLDSEFENAGMGYFDEDGHIRRSDLKMPLGNVEEFWRGMDKQGPPVVVGT